MLKDGAHFYGESLAAVLALVDADASALALQLGDPLAVAAGANGTVRPKVSFNPLVGFFLGFEPL